MPGSGQPPVQGTGKGQWQGQPSLLSGQKDHHATSLPPHCPDHRLESSCSAPHQEAGYKCRISASADLPQRNLDLHRIPRKPWPGRCLSLGWALWLLCQLGNRNEHSPILREIDASLSIQTTQMGSEGHPQLVHMLRTVENPVPGRDPQGSCLAPVQTHAHTCTLKSTHTLPLPPSDFHSPSQQHTHNDKLRAEFLQGTKSPSSRKVMCKLDLSLSSHCLCLIRSLQRCVHLVGRRGRRLA